MRILVLSNLYPPYAEGGAEVLAADIVEQLEHMGHEVLVLTSSHGVGHPCREGRIWRTLRLAPPVHFDRQRPVWRQLDLPWHYIQRYHSAANATAIQQVVADTRPDVLYVWETTGLGVTSILRVLARLNIPIVLHLGSYWLLYARSPQTAQSEMRLRWLKQRLIGSVPEATFTSLIAVSESLRREYVRAGFDGERIEVIHNGVSQRFLLEPAPHRGGGADATRPAELLFVGRLCREKGTLTLLKALDRLANGDVDCSGDFPRPHLTIVGDGDAAYVGELRAFVKHTKLEALVTFRARVTQEELVIYYDAADVMIVPSLWQEPFGLVVTEAMSRGLPVIATRVGGLAEIVTHDETGLLVEPDDERGLALAIRDLVADPIKRQRLGEAADAMVRQRFTIERNASRVAEHLRRAIQGERGRARIASM